MSKLIIQNGNMKDNIPGWPYYHVSRDGKVYSRKSGNWKLLRGGIIGRVINKKSYRDENIDRKR